MVSVRTIIEIKILAIIVGSVLFLSIVHQMQFFELFVTKTEIILHDISNDNFTQFALAINFAYEMIPQMAQFISVGAIGHRLLERGFNPWVFAGFIAVGKLTGQMILYSVGMAIKALHKKEFQFMENVAQYFHKYHYLVFVLPPWMGVVGDGIMVTAGHERISLLRMIPILIATDYAEALRWVLPTLGQIGLSDVIEGS